jgi:hypothetical protein
MQRRRFIAVAVAGVLASGGLAACGDSPNEGNNKKAGSGVTFLNVGMPGNAQVTETHNPFLLARNSNLMSSFGVYGHFATGCASDFP